VARWLDMAAIPFLVLAGVGLARLPIFPADLLPQVLVLGLTFLLFMAGLELSPRRVREQRATALRVGFIQFLVLGTLAVIAALLLGFDRLTAVYIGLALAASSTLLSVRMLIRRRQLFEPFGKLVVGVLLLQDMLVILMIPLLTQAPGGLDAVLQGFAGTVALVVLAYLCLRFVTPHVALLRLEPEMLLLTVLAILSCFIGLAHVLALPLAAGAFLAGIALSPFPMRGIIRGQLGSVSEFFTASFFIGLGGLLQPLAGRELFEALVFTLLVLIVTPPLVTMIAERAGFSARTALESGLLLSQTSELSLVLALQGYLTGVLTEEVFTMLAVVTVVTMVLTPYISSERVVQWLMHLQPNRRTERNAAPPRDHVLLLGCGSGGMPLLETLFTAGHEVVVIDDDPEVIDRLRRGDVLCIRGDAAEPQALEAAGAQHALIISSTIRRPRDNQQLLQAVHGSPPVLVRVFEDQDAEWVRAHGGTPIIYSEAAAEEFVRWFDDVIARRITDRRAQPREPSRAEVG
jgi:CPA2 family monovalent cation:H+ antiporter-2